jgi:hypothetical protein
MKSTPPQATKATPDFDPFAEAVADAPPDVLVDEADTDSDQRSLIVNGTGQGAELQAQPMAAIIQQIQHVFGDWPRRVGNTLFIDDREHGLHHLTKSADLFGWLHSKAAIQWYRGPSCVSRDDLFCELQRTAQSHKAIEAYQRASAVQSFAK